MKKSVIIIIIIIIFILGIIIGYYFSKPIQNSKESADLIKNFNVKYYAKYSSSAGDRILNITYYVNNGAITSCDGNYSYPPSQSQRDSNIYDNNLEPCNVEKLKNESYNVPIKLITSVDKNQKMSEEINEGPSLYRYEIILN